MPPPLAGDLVFQLGCRMPDPFVFPGEVLGKWGQGSDVGLCSSGSFVSSSFEDGPSIALLVALPIALPIASHVAFVHLPLLSQPYWFAFAASVDVLGNVVCLT